jgi:arsenical resistance protein ArsH
MIPPATKTIPGGSAASKSQQSSSSNDAAEPSSTFAWEQIVAQPTTSHPAWLPHRLTPGVPSSGPGAGTASDWVPGVLPYLSDARDFAARYQASRPLRVLVLYSTLRPAGFSRLVSYECARLIEGLGADVRVFNPSGIPVRDPALQDHDKVVEFRALVEWSEAHIWVGSELHGGLSSVLTNLINWIPLNSGSVRPTQGKSVALFAVSGGSQSFNTLNSMRLFARWMRMPCVVNQSQVQMAWKEFDDAGRMKDSSMRERVVDVCEEFIKFAVVARENAEPWVDRYSERKEREAKGRLLTQAEKEAEKASAAAAAIKHTANNE